MVSTSAKPHPYIKPTPPWHTWRFESAYFTLISVWSHAHFNNHTTHRIQLSQYIIIDCKSQPQCGVPCIQFLKIMKEVEWDVLSFIIPYSFSNSVTISCSFFSWAIKCFLLESWLSTPMQPLSISPASQALCPSIHALWSYVLNSLPVPSLLTPALSHN